MQKSRVSLSGMDAFVSNKKAETQKNGEGKNGEKEVTTAADTPVQLLQEPETESINPPVTPDPQTELGLGEPPADMEEEKKGDTWADNPSEVQLKQWWEEFLETQHPRISSLLRMTVPAIDKEEVVIVMPPSRIEALEPVKYPFSRFIEEISNGRLKRLRIEAGEVEQTERKPYTEKEKLEYLQKKNPNLTDVIQKLDLRLP